MLETAEVIDKAGVALTFWQIILMLFLGEHLARMWVLILNLQFISYIAQWQIDVPYLTKLILHEIKRLVLNEVLDDSELGQKVIETLGIEALSWSPIEDKIGDERLG